MHSEGVQAVAHFLSGAVSPALVLRPRLESAILVDRLVGTYPKAQST